MLGGNEQGGAVRSARREELTPEHEKPGGIVWSILDFRDQQLEPIDFRGSIPSDSGRAAFIPGATSSLCVAGHRHELNIGQVLREPGAALSQRLLVRADAFDIFERGHLPHKTMMNAQLHFAADLEWRSQKPVERVVDRAFAG